MISNRKLRRLSALFALSAALFATLPQAIASQNGDILQRAKTALRSGNGIAAEVELKRLIDGGSSRATVAALMGEALILQGDYIKAREWLAPQNFSVETSGLGFQLLGRLNQREGDIAAAAAAYDKALGFSPDEASLWVDIGRLRYLGGAQTQAVEASKHAVNLDPDNAAALQFRGQLVRDAAGPGAAVAWFAAALERSPDDLALMGDYAATLGEIGRAKEMLTITRQMLKLDRNNSRAFYLQAVLAARAGRDDLARSLLWKTEDNFRETPAGLLLSGIIDLRSGNLRNAVQTLDKLSALQPDNLQASGLLASALAQSGLHREIVQRFSKEAARADASPYLLTLVGRAHEKLGQREAAAAYLDRAAKPRDSLLENLNEAASVSVAEAMWRENPDAANRTLDFVRTLISSGQAGRGVQISNIFLRQHRGSADAQTLTGDANLAAGRSAAALSHYREAAKVRMNFSLLRRMIFAHTQLRQRDAALDLLDDFLASNPLSGDAAALRAEFSVQAGDFDKARGLLEHAIKQRGETADPVLLGQYALVALKLGDLETAQQAAQKAYALQKSHPAATFALARVIEQTGSDQASVEALLFKALGSSQIDRINTAS